MQVPSSAISRVIGRGDCNINLIREVSGAIIVVEKQRGSGERVITIKLVVSTGLLLVKIHAFQLDEVIDHITICFVGVQWMEPNRPIH